MGHCSSHFLIPCVKTEEENFNYSQSDYDMNNTYNLMEKSLFIEENAVRKISLLVKIGVDIDAREQKTGNSFLHIAVKKRNYELAEWLCGESNVIGGAINYLLQTPYHLAYYAHDQKMMDLLRANGAVCDDPVISGTCDEEFSVCFD